ncbi:MAG: hypothetical protein H6Q50_871, partial [Deltaproteobacteria bacterium]|nr:hypothetical protein [Deltaproteobacteria bacterium]
KVGDADGLSSTGSSSMLLNLLTSQLLLEIAVAKRVEDSGKV